MMTWIPAAWSADPFYEQRLNLGRTALAAGRAVDAVDQLRIASFGLLDDPKLLSQSLALLALAQNQLGRTTELETTLNRFIEVESRFASYDPTAIEPDEKTKFEALLVAKMPKATLMGVNTLRRLVGGAPASSGAGVQNTTPPPAQPAPSQAAPQTSSATPPASPSAAPPRTFAPAPAGEKVPKADEGAAPKPTNKPAAAAAALTADDALANANVLLKANKPAEAAAILNVAVQRDPNRRDVRLLLLQSATMSTNWPVAAAQIDKLRPFTADEAVYQFYAAVTLYESHDVTGAKTLMREALPKIARSPYVDYYAKKLSLP